MKSIGVAFAIAALALNAQNPGPNGPRGDPKKVQLVGDRFKPLKYDKMTPEQKKMIDDLFAGERGGAAGPFNVLLRNPELGNMVQKVGAEARFHVGIPEGVKEMAIIMVARHWTSHFEWYAHKRAALAAGIKPAIVDAIMNRQRPTGMSKEETVYNFADELLKTGRVSDSSFNGMVKQYDEKRVVNLVTLMGYYGIVSMLLNIDRYPLPDGAKEELK